MSNTKHTPGPWINTKEQGKLFGSFNAVNDEANKVTIAIVYGSNIEEAEANAKLIAASPDLLEALDELLNCDYTSGTHLYTAQLKAKAAIKKAIE